MRLLLISATQSPYFAHCQKELAEFLGPGKTVGFISAARLDGEKEYFRGIERRLADAVVKELVPIPWENGGRRVLDRVDAVIVGGGNSYALLKRLKESHLLEALRNRVVDGLPYVGSSAGSIIAGPNILTTNDWNVVAQNDFDAMAIVPFNINPHFTELESSDALYSAPRTVRIREYHRVWSNPVVAMEESAILKVLDNRISVLGRGRVRVFLAAGKHRWFRPGEELSFDASTYDDQSISRNED